MVTALERNGWILSHHCLLVLSYLQGLLLIWTQDLHDCMTYSAYHMLRTLSATALERKYKPSMDSKPPPPAGIELSVRAIFNLDTGLA